MKVPELPSSYQPGDVVNGHVLTERGHWVPVDSPRAAGLEHRHVGPTVSTVGEPGAGSGTGARTSPSDNPYLRPAPHVTPQGPGKPAKRAGCVAGIVVLLVGLGLLALIARLVVSFGGGLQETEPVWPTITEDWTEWEDFDPLVTTPELPSFTLSAEEAALLELSAWEVWHSDYSSHFVVTVAAPGLERSKAGVSLRLEALDAEGVTHEASDFITLRDGEPVVSAGFFAERFDAEIVDLSATFVPLSASTDPEPYRVELESFEVEDQSVRPWVRATVTAAAYGQAPPSLRVTAVVRDDDGEILNLGITYLPAPAPGETADVEFPLWDDAPVEDGGDWEFSLMAH